MQHIFPRGENLSDLKIEARASKRVENKKINKCVREILVARKTFRKSDPNIFVKKKENKFTKNRYIIAWDNYSSS